jgi:hypothetical protein
MNNNLALIQSITPESIANLWEFQPYNQIGKNILFANLSFEWISIPTDKQSLIDAIQTITDYNKSMIEIINHFAEKEEFYITTKDKKIQIIVREKLPWIKVENMLYRQKTKQSIKYIDKKVEGKDMVNIKDLQESLVEAMRLQKEINDYVLVAKSYSQ